MFLHTHHCENIELYAEFTNRSIIHYVPAWFPDFTFLWKKIILTGNFFQAELMHSAQSPSEHLPLLVYTEPTSYPLTGAPSPSFHGHPWLRTAALYITLTAIPEGLHWVALHLPLRKLDSGSKCHALLTKHLSPCPSPDTALQPETPRREAERSNQ